MPTACFAKWLGAEASNRFIHVDKLANRIARVVNERRAAQYPGEMDWTSDPAFGLAEKWEEVKKKGEEDEEKGRVRRQLFRETLSMDGFGKVNSYASCSMRYGPHDPLSDGFRCCTPIRVD